MKLSKLKPRISRTAHSVKHFFKKNKNDIIFVGGVATEITAVVTAARAGAKQRDMHEKYARQIDMFIDREGEDADIRGVNANGRRTIYRKIVKETIHNYALPAVLTAGSIGLYSKSHYNLKHELAATTAALAAEHALNQKLLAEKNADIPQEEPTNPKEECNAPYSAGIPNDLDDLIIENGVIIYDSETGYFAETDGYARPTTVMLSPTVIEWKKDKYSDWDSNFDWNLNQVKRIMRDVISKAISLYGFVNLNEVRKHFSVGRSYKLEEAENYYLIFDENRHEDDQVVYRIYGECDKNGVLRDRIFIDIFNTRVPKPGDLKEGKQRAVAVNPLKES